MSSAYTDNGCIFDVTFKCEHIFKCANLKPFLCELQTGTPTVTRRAKVRRHLNRAFAPEHEVPFANKLQAENSHGCELFLSGTDAGKAVSSGTALYTRDDMFLIIGNYDTPV